MSDLCTLTCWIRGESPENFFDIKIPWTEKVFALKEKIKEQHSSQFMDTPAYCIRLYKLKSFVDVGNLSTTTLSASGEVLSAIEKLSQVFTERPPEGSIHIIIDHPRIFYCIRGVTSLDGDLRITGSAVISELGPILKEKHPLFVGPYLEYYKGPTRAEELHEALDTLLPANRLSLTQRIHATFLDVPVLADTCIIVKVAGVTLCRDQPVITTKAILATEREKSVRNLFPKGIQSQSDSTHSSSFHLWQANKATRIPCGRPREDEELIPATLLHEVFGKFADDCRTHKMTAWDNECVEDLAIIMSKTHDSEESRAEAVVDALQMNYVYGIALEMSGSENLAEVSISATRNGHPLPYMIGKFKNEAATSNSDPYIQAITHYVRATSSFAVNMWWSTLPCLFLVVTGPCIFFAAATWTTRPCVQMLSMPLTLGYHSTDDWSRITAARHLAAFQTAIYSLKTYYESLPVSDVVPGDTANIQYPYRRHYMSLDGRRIDFTYDGQLDAGSKRLVFRGTIQEDSVEVPIFIKFARRYSRDAHMHFADQGIAPKLRGCEPLPGNWYLVVMDMLAGYESLRDVDKREEKIPKEVFDDMEVRLKGLHERHLVHGDIRTTNIMIKKNDRTKYMIIDFDWAGEIGKVEYPAYVNHWDINRPMDAVDETPILAEHDRIMFNDIRYRLEAQGA